MNGYVSIDDIVKRYIYHAEEKAGKEISQIIYEVKKHNEDMIPVSELWTIRKEIENLPKLYPYTDHVDNYIKTSDVLKIIDKYMESEDKE